MSDDDRKNYWNAQYYQYFKERVSEANKDSGNSQIVKGDQPMPNDLTYVEAIEQLQIKKHYTVLELGCGFGRSIPYISTLCRKVYAADISESMIQGAKELCKDLNNIEFIVSEAESINIESGNVDSISCFGVFDALYQKKHS